MDNIVLCGFMGCGKSTVGTALAALLRRPFVDMDAEIERGAGMSVSEIFERFGETHFRALETQCAKTLAARGGLVVSTGGGALLNPENAAVLGKNGAIVLIDVPLEIIRSRLEGDNTRPLLSGADHDAKLAALYSSRMDAYRTVAGLTVRNTDDRPAERVAHEIAGLLGFCPVG